MSDFVIDGWTNEKIIGWLRIDSETSIRTELPRSVFRAMPIICGKEYLVDIENQIAKEKFEAQQEDEGKS